jgi:hypothetical protein
MEALLTCARVNVSARDERRELRGAPVVGLGHRREDARVLPVLIIAIARAVLA